jgi:hypothetical protein
MVAWKLIVYFYLSEFATATVRYDGDAFHVLDASFGGMMAVRKHSLKKPASILPLAAA